MKACQTQLSDRLPTLKGRLSDSDPDQTFGRSDSEFRNSTDCVEEVRVAAVLKH
jgi:hypothetical protein